MVTLMLDSYHEFQLSELCSIVTHQTYDGDVIWVGEARRKCWTRILFDFISI